MNTDAAGTPPIVTGKIHVVEPPDTAKFTTPAAVGVPDAARITVFGPVETKSLVEENEIPLTTGVLNVYEPATVTFTFTSAVLPGPTGTPTA